MIPTIDQATNSTTGSPSTSTPTTSLSTTVYFTTLEPIPSISCGDYQTGIISNVSQEITLNLSNTNCDEVEYKIILKQIETNNTVNSAYSIQIVCTPKLTPNPTINPSISPTKPPTTNVLKICYDSKYVGGLSAFMYIDTNSNVTNSKYMTKRKLIDYMITCKSNNRGDMIIDIDDDTMINYNEYIAFYVCFQRTNDETSILSTISSAEFRKCIEDNINKNEINGMVSISDILILLKDIHQYVEFAISDFQIFVIIMIVMSILIILTLLNWFHSKGSYCLCCWCSSIGCMAADEANLTIMFIVSLRIGDLITDCLLSYNIYAYYIKYENNNIHMFVLTIINICTLILPYFIINIWTLYSASKLNVKTDRLREWFGKYKLSILIIVGITGDAYVSLLLFTSNLFGVSLFDSGLNSWHLRNLRKFKIATIICENIPQMATQMIFAFWTKNIEIVILSLIFSFSLNFVSVIAWCINRNFDKTCIPYHYYIEVKLEKSNTFYIDDLSKIRRYSKCRNRLKEKLVNIIRENTSSVECQVYYVEMIGSGCNIHIIYYLTKNTKIRRDSFGSVPVSDMDISMDIDTIITQIFDGKYDLIEEQLETLWHLKGNISVLLHHDMLPNKLQHLQMSLQNIVNTQIAQ